MDFEKLRMDFETLQMDFETLRMDFPKHCEWILEKLRPICFARFWGFWAPGGRFSGRSRRDVQNGGGESRLRALSAHFRPWAVFLKKTKQKKKQKKQV